MANQISSSNFLYTYEQSWDSQNPLFFCSTTVTSSFENPKGAQIAYVFWALCPLETGSM